MSDELLGAFVPVLVYWVYSGIYMMLGSLDNYRLHSREDEETKNLVPKGTVVKGVFLQQFIQAVVAILLFTVTGKNNNSDEATTQHSALVLAMQFLIAMLVLDTWQYFITDACTATSSCFSISTLSTIGLLCPMHMEHYTTIQLKDLF